MELIGGEDSEFVYGVMSSLYIVWDRIWILLIVYKIIELYQNKMWNPIW